MNNFFVLHSRFRYFLSKRKEIKYLSDDFNLDGDFIPFVRSQIRLLEYNYDSTRFQKRLVYFLQDSATESQYINVIFQVLARISPYQQLINFDSTQLCKRYIKYQTYSQSVIQFIVQASKLDLIPLFELINIVQPQTVTYTIWAYYVFILNGQQLYQEVLNLVNKTINSEFFSPTGTDSVLKQPQSFYFIHIATFSFSTLYYSQFLSIFIKNIQFFDRRIRKSYLKQYLAQFDEGIFEIMAIDNGTNLILPYLDIQEYQALIFVQIESSQEEQITLYKNEILMILRKLLLQGENIPIQQFVDQLLIEKSL